MDDMVKRFDMVNPRSIKKLLKTVEIGKPYEFSVCEVCGDLGTYSRKAASCTKCSHHVSLLQGRIMKTRKWGFFPAYTVIPLSYDNFFPVGKFYGDSLLIKCRKLSHGGKFIEIFVLGKKIKDIENIGSYILTKFRNSDIPYPPYNNSNIIKFLENKTLPLSEKELYEFNLKFAGQD